MSQHRGQDKPKSAEDTDKDIHSKEKDVASDAEKLEVEKGKNREGEMTLEALQKIIVERTAKRKQVAEVKRLEGLTRIAAMKSKDGTHPLLIFPNEIWLQILGDKDLSPRDHYNVRQVHSVFRDLTEDTMVLDILLPLAMDYKIPFLERLFHSLDNRDLKWQIKILQNVSASLKNGVNNWIHDSLLNSMTSGAKAPRLQEYWIFRNRYDDVTTLTSTATSECFPKSLRVLFSILMVEGNVEERRISWANCKDSINDLLGKIGNQILHLELLLNDSNSYRGKEKILTYFGLSNVELYSTVKDWLHLVPNLKWLTLKTEKPYWDARITYKGPLISMPKLNGLERVDILDWGISPLVEAVLSANRHVKCVVTAHLPTSRPIVRRLSLEIIDAGNTLHYRDVKFLQEMSHSSWNLKKLTLWIKDVSVTALFQCLGDNCPNLEHLSLHLRNATIGKELNFLRLPNLKNLELDLGKSMTFTGDFHFFFGLHFLLYCDKLELLKWTNLVHEADLFKIGLEMVRGGKSKRLIDFQGEGGVLQLDLNKFSIWDVFPRLKCITAKFRSYWFIIKERRGSVSVHRGD